MIQYSKIIFFLTILTRKEHFKIHSTLRKKPDYRKSMIKTSNLKITKVYDKNY